MTVIKAILAIPFVILGHAAGFLSEVALDVADFLVKP
jgi:hypothetical protein